MTDTDYDRDLKTHDWIRWRIGLFVGKALKRVGGALLDAGWAVTEKSARRAHDIIWQRNRGSNSL